MAPNLEPAVIARRQGRIGRLTINRPKTLNAVDHDMLRSIRDALERWREEPAIHAIVIEGAGDRAFCSGGDIRQVRNMALAGRFAEIDAFFADEYALNLAIARYPKPYIALIDGVCMGGGMGLAIHGSARVVTEAAILAMPETGIGFFPDVGASFFLPRLRSSFGMLLALTGTRASGADAVFLGLATHYVSRERIITLADEISENGPAVLAAAAVPSPPSPLSGLTDITLGFGAETAVEIVQYLARQDTQPARDTLAKLRSMSPTATLWAFELLRRGSNRTLEHCLTAELKLARHASRHPDFSEGVRAMVVDKDRTPHWSPGDLAAVDTVGFATLFQ